MEILKKHSLLLLIIIFSTVVMTKNIDKPFVGHHDWNGAWHGIAAKNMARYGLFKVRFASVMNAQKSEPSNFVYFTHYPPLVPIFIYLSIKIFGTHDWSIRVVPIFFSIMTIVTVYKLSGRFFGKKTAVIASSLVSVFPILIYFGRVPTHDIIAIPFVLTSIIFYFNFFDSPSKKNFALVVISIILSHLTHWSGYYVTPLFFLHFLFFSKHKRRFQIAALFPIISILMFSPHMLHVRWLTGDAFGGGLLSILKTRMNLEQRPQGYSEINYIKQEARLLVIYFTRPVIALSLITLFLCLIKSFQKKITNQEALVFMLLVIGMIPIILFRNLAYIHDFIIISFLPFFAVAAAIAAARILTIINRRGATQAVILLLLLLLVLLERYKFTKALLTGTPFETGRQLGQIINKKTNEEEKTLVLSNDIKTHFDVQTSYYAQRTIDYGVISLESLENDLRSKKYELVIATPKRDTPQTHVEVLQKYYKHSKIDQFEVFEKK